MLSVERINFFLGYLDDNLHQRLRENNREPSSLESGLDIAYRPISQLARSTRPISSPDRSTPPTPTPQAPRVRPTRMPSLYCNFKNVESVLWQ